MENKPWLAPRKQKISRSSARQMPHLRPVIMTPYHGKLNPAEVDRVIAEYMAEQRKKRA